MPFRFIGECGTGCMAFLAGASGLLASAVVDLPDANKLEALAKIPLVIILGLVCVFCVWIIYRQSCEFRKSIDAMTASNTDIAKLLASRPCIRPRSDD